MATHRLVSALPLVQLGEEEVIAEPVRTYKRVPQPAGVPSPLASPPDSAGSDTTSFNSGGTPGSEGSDATASLNLPIG